MPSRRTRLTEWIAREQPVQIGEREWESIAYALAPVSEGYLRKLLRESGVPLAPLIEGVRQETLDALETSLLRILDEYEAGRKMEARKAVITAKDHARLAARRGADKQEMILWMLTWLENPGVFREWIRLRRSARA